MNLLWLVDKYNKAVEEKEKENLRREIDEILNAGPLTFKDIVVIVSSITVTTAVIVGITKVLLFTILKKR